MNKVTRKIAKNCGFCFWSGESWGEAENEVDLGSFNNAEFNKFIKQLVTEVTEYAFEHNEYRCNVIDHFCEEDEVELSPNEQITALKQQVEELQEIVTRLVDVNNSRR